VLVAVDGCDVGVRALSIGNFGEPIAGLMGLNAGVRALRNSV
jgi:hypothetical protein